MDLDRGALARLDGKALILDVLGATTTPETEEQKAYKKGTIVLLENKWAQDPREDVRQAYAAAATPEQRARASNREAGALDGLGRYTEVLQALKRGMQEVGVAPEFRDGISGPRLLRNRVRESHSRGREEA